MERLKIIIHKGKSILYINFSGLKTSNKKGFKEFIDQANDYISKQPLNSLLTLTDFTGIQFELEIVTMIIDYAKHNRKYVKISALLGVEGYSNIILNSTKKITQRNNFRTFNNQDDALDWLAQQ